MRNPERIPVILERIGEVWKKFPDWRFGQLISNFESWYGRDIFFLEDERFVELLEKFATGDQKRRMVMDTRKIQRIAANEYNCCKTKNCDCKCEQCPYNISDEDEEEFFYTIWQIFSDKRRKGWW